MIMSEQDEYKPQEKVVRGDSKIPAPPVYVSASEIDAHDADIKAALETLGLDYVLTNLWGFDNTKIVEGSDTYYTIDECTHRTRIKKEIVTGSRYSGVERLDDDWILRGNPSESAKVIARQDASYIQEVKHLSRRSKASKM